MTTPNDPAEPTDAATADADAAAGTEPESSEDAMRRKFQEALARKHDGGGASGHAASAQGRGVGPSAGGKVQRQFRRKSG